MRLHSQKLFIAGLKFRWRPLVANVMAKCQNFFESVASKFSVTTLLGRAAAVAVVVAIVNEKWSHDVGFIPTQFLPQYY